MKICLCNEGEPCECWQDGYKNGFEEGYVQKEIIADTIEKPDDKK